MKTVLIGAGYRGRALAGLLRGMPFFELVAVADPRLGEMPSGDAGVFEDLRLYTDGPEDYRRMLAEERPELVFICSPWDCHIPQALDCLKAGCHVALEIRGGCELGEYQPLMDSPGKVFPLENLLFRRDILAVREMVRAGLFGEIVSLRGGYRHDLRDELVDAAGVLGGNAAGLLGGDAPAAARSAAPGSPVAAPAGAAPAAVGSPVSAAAPCLRERPSEAWRGRLYTSENADIYPTHSIAPLCFIGGIRSLASVSSFASKAAGLRERLGEGCPEITLGDIVSTVARTSDGKLLTLTHDTTLPRPRSYGIEIQGTRGIWDEENHRIYIEGRSPFEEWEPDAAYVEEFLDPMWRRWGAEALAADHHHGGMDYIMLRAIEEDLRGSSSAGAAGFAAASADSVSSASAAGSPTPGFSYPATLADLALWTSITPLSAKSIASGKTILL